jgi:Zn-dependent peptidase ImmA (M78 family)
MSPPLPSEASGPDIQAAIQRVYRDAGLDPGAVRPGVVPLYHLVGAYPLRVAEIRNLTYSSARGFLVKETQQQVPVPQEGERKLSGFLYIYRYAGCFYGCVLVEQADPVARRRFSVAHELGHYLLHFLPLLQQPEDKQSLSCVITEGLSVPDEDSDAALPIGQLWLTSPSEEDDRGPAPDGERLEDEANRFAADLLTPEPAVRRLAERYRREMGARRPVLARRLATEFLVSRQAMTRRLEALGLPAPSGHRVAAAISESAGE